MPPSSRSSRPESPPFLAHRWDETVAALHAFRARWNVTSGGRGRWEWALVQRRDDPGMNEERRHVAACLVDLAVETVKESTRNEGAELPAWARSHLAHHVALGACVHDPHRLRDLYRRIDTYRQEAGITEVENPANGRRGDLGRTTDDAVLRITRISLAEEALGCSTSIARPTTRRFSP